MNDLISVIVPVYNVGCYVSECIESILKQTYQNLDIILIDDGSTDNSGKICDSYAKRDKRIRVIHKKNEGVANARNIGIQMAMGEYIGFVDSDDYIEKDMYEYLHEILKSNDADISICNYKKRYTKVDTERVGESYENKITILGKEEGIKELIIDKNVKNYLWNKLYKISLFKNLKFPDGKKMEDYAVMYKLFYGANRIVIGNDCKYVYNQRDNSILGNKNSQFYIDYLNVAIERYNFLEKNMKFNLNKENIIKVILKIFLIKDDIVSSYLKKNNIKKLCKSIYQNKNEKISIRWTISYWIFCMNTNLYIYLYRFIYTYILKIEIGQIL